MKKRVGFFACLADGADRLRSAGLSLQSTIKTHYPDALEDPPDRPREMRKQQFERGMRPGMERWVRRIESYAAPSLAVSARRPAGLTVSAAAGR